jgi:Flp pilus assembly protein TadD
VLRCGEFLLVLLNAGVLLTGEDAKALLGQGLTHLEHARYQQAIELLERAVALEPSLALAQYDLGICYFAEGQFDAARRAFELARRLNPDQPLTEYYLARLELLEGHVDAAIHGLISLSVQPLADESYYLGSAYLRKGELEPAMQSLKKAIAQKPEDARAHFLLARVYLKAGMDAQAKQEFARSEQLRTADQRKARDILACDAALNSLDRDGALSRCRELLDGSDPVKLVRLGIALAQWRLYQLAIEPFRKAARLDPENFEPHYNLGLTFFRMKDYAAARGPLETAAGLRSEYFDAIALLGSTLFALGDDANALKHLRHAHQLRPQDEKIRSLLIEELTITAKHLEAGGEHPQSVALLEEARRLESGARN